MSFVSCRYVVGPGGCTRLWPYSSSFPRMPSKSSSAPNVSWTCTIPVAEIRDPVLLIILRVEPVRNRLQEPRGKRIPGMGGRSGSQNVGGHIRPSWNAGEDSIDRRRNTTRGETD